MQRTQVYFPKEVLDQLRREAYEEKTSLAEVIRRKVMRGAIKTKGPVQKKMHTVEEMSKVNLSLPSDWKKIKKIIHEVHSPFHTHRG